MRVQYLAGLLAAVAILVAGCGSGQTVAVGAPNTGPTTASPGKAALNLPRNPSSTVTIDGQVYICETVTGINNGNCSVEAQQVFDSHKDDIDPYVNSGRLGELSDYRYSIQDAAYVGIGSCAYHMRGQSIEVFIAFLRKEPTFKDVPDEDIRLAGREAQKMLCPAGTGQNTV